MKTRILLFVALLLIGGKVSAEPQKAEGRKKVAAMTTTMRPL